MAQAMKVPVVVPEAAVRRAVNDLMRPWLPIPVTVDDEHAQPVTGYLLRLPEEMGGGWLVMAPDDGKPVVQKGYALRWDATDAQARARDLHDEDVIEFRGRYYERARWRAEAYRVALAEEQAA